MIQCSRCRFHVRAHTYQGKPLTADVPCPWCGGPLIGAGQAPVLAQQPLVSIVVPVYCGEQWMSQLAQTIRGQVYSNVEVILSGDDCTPSVAAFEGLRVTSLGSAQRQGIAITTNRGILAASGDYILHLDQDDLLLPNCVSVLLQRFEARPELGAVYARQELRYPDHSETPALVPYTRLGMLGTNIMGHPVMVRREVMRRCLLDPRDDLAQDCGYNLRLSETCLVEGVDEVLYVWNLHGQNPSLVDAETQYARVLGTTKAAIARRMANPSVALVLPGLGVCGGIRIVLEVANRLHDRGWDVWVVDPNDTTPPDRLRVHAPDCFVPLRVPVVGSIPTWCDIAVATGWQTVPLVWDHEQRGYGFAAWYIQNWEADWGRGFVKTNPGIRWLACCAEHLQLRLRDTWGQAATILPSGIDLEQWPFRPRHSGCQPAPSRVLIPWREAPYKDPQKLLEIARLLKATGRELLMLSPTMPRPDVYQEFQQCWHIDTPQEDLSKLFSICDFIVTASRSEGHAVIVLEAMATGAIPVVQSIGNTMNVLPGTGLLVDGTPDEFAQALDALEAQRCTWGARRRKGRAVAEQYGWTSVIPQWESFLREVAYEGYAALL